MSWADNSEQVIIQYVNRLQNRNDVTFADVMTGDTRIVFTDRGFAVLGGQG